MYNKVVFYTLTMPGITHIMKKSRFDGSLFPKDFKESQRKYSGVAIPLSDPDPDVQFAGIEYSLDDITLHDGTKIEGIIDKEILMSHLENDDIYLFEADSQYLGNGRYILTNIIIPRKV
jgi:hypothetical protein